jgi:hypothetical protein
MKGRCCTRFATLSFRSPVESMPSELTHQQVEELSQIYWDTDVSTKELQDHFGLLRAVHRYITPFTTGENCPNYSADLVYPSRSARGRGEKECRACGKGRQVELWVCL